MPFNNNNNPFDCELKDSGIVILAQVFSACRKSLDLITGRILNAAPHLQSRNPNRTKKRTQQSKKHKGGLKSQLLWSNDDDDDEERGSQRTGSRQGNKTIAVVGWVGRRPPLIYLCMPNPFFVQIKLTFNTREKCP